MSRSPNRAKLPAAQRCAAPPNDAIEQVRLIAGSADATIRLRAICSRSGQDQRRAEEREGTLADLAAWATDRSADGFNVYMVAQSLKADRDTVRFVRDADVDAVRVLFADGDDTPLPADWHVRPSFILRHPNRRWWAFWSVEGVPVADLRELQQRIALHYGSDKSVCNPARIVRLAGFDRWKDGKNHGPYQLLNASADKSAGDWHSFMLPALPSRTEYKGGRSEDQVIAFDRLKGLLAHIPSDDRDVWRDTCFAMRDATVIDANRLVVDDFDVLMLFDEWSSRSAKYQGAEDCENLWHGNRGETTTPKTLGSIVRMAKTRGAPEELCRPAPVERVHGMFTALPKPANDDAEPVGLVCPEGLWDGPALSSRPKGKPIIPGVLMENSYSVASGRSGAGKSFTELALALSIATGKPWLGMTPEQTGPVLYIAAEGQERIERDMQAWCAVFGVDYDSLRGRFFVFDRGARLNTQEGREKLEKVLAWIKHVTGRLPLYAVADTLRRNMRGSVSDEGDASDVLSAVAELQLLGIAITLVAHHGRSHGETKGLTDWEDDADQVRRYDGLVKTDDTKVEFYKVKSDRDGWSIAVDLVTQETPDGATRVATGGGAEGATPPAEAVEKRRQKLAPSSAQEKFTREMVEKAAIEYLGEIGTGRHASEAELAQETAIKLGDPDMAEAVRKRLQRIRAEDPKGGLANRYLVGQGSRKVYYGLRRHDAENRLNALDHKGKGQ